MLNITVDAYQLFAILFARVLYRGVGPLTDRSFDSLSSSEECSHSPAS